MPGDAWLLLVLSVGLGLGVELVYMRARWAERSRDGVGAAPRGEPGQPAGGGGGLGERPDAEGEGGPEGEQSRPPTGGGA